MSQKARNGPEGRTRSCHLSKPGVFLTCCGLFERSIPPFHSACFTCAWAANKNLGCTARWKRRPQRLLDLCQSGRVAAPVREGGDV